jgi:hypothetical protein
MIRVYFWQIPKSKILWSFMRMGLDRVSLWRMPGVEFWKLLGTGKGETFTPRDANPQRWGLLVVINSNYLSNFDSSSLLARWRRHAISEYMVELSPISVHGKWSRTNPFANLPIKAKEWDGAVVAITRARIKWRKNLIFWRSVPPVTTSLHSSPGLKAAIGIGEAPLGLQGTFSIWESAAAVRDFAYRGEAHKAAIAATHREKWYSEELFSRFAVTKEQGNL